jgi:GNAT superfamily N-acetyltransferase
MDPELFRKTYITRLGEKDLLLRQLIPADAPLLQQGFKTLSERSRYLRFFTVHSSLSAYQLDQFSRSDGYHTIAWGVLDISGSEEIPVGVARFVRTKDDDEVAEVAITVVDRYQRMGIGRLLFALINVHAIRIGVQRFRYYVLGENIPVLNMIAKFDILSRSKEKNIKIIETPVWGRTEQIPVSESNMKFIRHVQDLETFFD